MRMLSVIIAVAFLWSGFARAQDADSCEVPSYLLFSDHQLKRVATTAKEQHRLDIAVVGTASSMLPGASGADGNAYPRRLEAALRRRLPGISVNVTSDAKARRTAADMVQNLENSLREFRPVLVIWQTGTVDAIRGIDPDEFRATLFKGADVLHAGGADAILMNMQYSPRTELMIALEAYEDNMRVVAREREVPLFDRRAIMRNWSDSGVFDLYTGHKDSAIAQKVHDCIARALASMIIDAAQLAPIETNAVK